MKFKTSITQIKNNEEFLRGEPLASLVAEGDFVSTIFLALTGKKPTEAELHVLSAILVAVIDHGPGVASAMNARISASADNPIHASLAAGLLGFGDRHGMAATRAMELFREAMEFGDIDAWVAEKRSAKIRIAGYGHKLFTDHDPRARMLFKIATDHGVYGEYCVQALGIGAALNEVSSKQLPLNIDGAIAAILCDMGLDPLMGDVLFLIGRVPGLLAHIIEEKQNDVGIRRTGEEDIEFVV